MKATQCGYWTISFSLNISSIEKIESLKSRGGTSQGSSRFFGSSRRDETVSSRLVSPNWDSPISRLISSHQFEMQYLVSFHEPKTSPKICSKIGSFGSFSTNLIHFFVKMNLNWRLCDNIIIMYLYNNLNSKLFGFDEASGKVSV